MLYMVTFTINIPPLLAYIYHTWILRVKYCMVCGCLWMFIDVCDLSHYQIHWVHIYQNVPNRHLIKSRSDRCKSLGPVTSSFTTTYRLRDWRQKFLMFSWFGEILIIVGFNTVQCTITNHLRCFCLDCGCAVCWEVCKLNHWTYASWITEPPERVLGGWKIPES